MSVMKSSYTAAATQCTTITTTATAAVERGSSAMTQQRGPTGSVKITTYIYWQKLLLNCSTEQEPYTTTCVVPSCCALQLSSMPARMVDTRAHTTVPNDKLPEMFAQLDARISQMMKAVSSST
eukprot:2931-Heterococcus_DN1.PRE.3